MSSHPDRESRLRPATPEDAAALARVYNHYIENTVVTFEETPVSPADMTSRLSEIRDAEFPWLVADRDGDVAGFAYAGPWKGRCAYRHSAEITVYLDPQQVGRGLGSQLYAELINILKDRGFHAIMGGIALPNAASVALHEKFGLEKVAHFKEVGFKFERWVDVGYWQRRL